MTSRINTRSTRSNMIGVPAGTNKMLGLRTNNCENNSMARPIGKAGIGLGGVGGLKDASNRQQGGGGGVKRKADTALDGAVVTKKRSVLGDVTNAIEKTLNQGRKEVQKLGKRGVGAGTSSSFGVANKTTISSMAKQVNSRPAAPLPAKTKSLAPATGKLASVTALPGVAAVLKKTLKSSSGVLVEEEDRELVESISYCEVLPSSQELLVNNKHVSLDSSNYVTASEASPVISRVVTPALPSVPEEEEESSSSLPEGVVDYDKECEMDPFAVALYANEIFCYYREREAKFAIEKYLDTQPEISVSMRAILVDWMVEVQESFELNHETLYLAVKLVDLYLSRVVITRDQLQLVGSTALFIACKFDERTPPYIDDFLYICDDAYKRKELITYEIKMLKAIGFDLGIPLSYRYLRRYARCAKVSMEELTLARYILELSLMEYDLLDASDHTVAAAALLLARCITGSIGGPWTPTLQHYSGLAVEDLYHLTHVLHAMLTQPPRDHLKTVRNKYSHEVFYEVAKIPVPDTLDL